MLKRAMKTTLFLLLICFSTGSIGWADWVQEGDALTTDPNKASYVPDIAFAGNIPYVACSEGVSGGIGQAIVKHFNGSAWVQDGGSLNVDPTVSAGVPSIAIINQKPYGAWEKV